MDGNLAMNSHFENMSEKDSNDMADHFLRLEGNKLIASFMGFEAHPENASWFRLNYPDGTVGAWGLVGYDVLWDWLMPVVEKISRIEFERRYDEDQEKWVIWTHHPVTFGMLDDQGRAMVRFYCSTLHFGKTLMEATWNAVVDFVKWYLESQKLIKS